MAAFWAETINAGLVVLVTLAAFAICVETAGSDTVKALSVELFGESEGNSLFEMLKSVYEKSTRLISPLSALIRKLFLRVGKRYEKKGDGASLEAVAQKASDASKDLSEKLNKKKGRA